jgi:uncharacterized damage-inducible protein DinB
LTATEGVAYHGPSTRSNLDGITAERAAARPVPHAHSIWELVLHLRFGREWSLEAIRGKKLDADDWWPTPGAQGPEEWSSLLRSLDDLRDRVLKTVEALSPEQVSAAQSGFRFLIHHELYHSGQIALARKASGMPGRPG